MVRSVGGSFVRTFMRAAVRVEFGFIQFALGSFYADCLHKRIL